MKAKFFPVLALLVLILSTGQAYAEIGFGILAGVQSNQAETDINNARTNSRAGFHYGVLSLIPVRDAFEARSGFFYTQRYAEITNTASGDVTIDYAYFDVPMTVLYRFSSAAGVFAGPVIGFNFSKDVNCSRSATCVAWDVRSVIFPLQMGLNFKFMPQAGGELYFEYVPGDLSTNVSNMKTVGGHLIYYFE